VSGITHAIHRLESAAAGLAPGAALAKRREIIREVDAQGLIATPANSYINELVVEAARASILSDATPARIVYGTHPHIEIAD
jgi:ABC-type proline/glycine betaine transport system ATPase subunit